MISLKKCSSHRGYLPRTEFSKDPSRKDGRAYICKACRSKVQKKYNDNWRNKTPAVFKHGMTGTPEHEAWMGAVKRCHVPTYVKYRRWGGRGIRVCKEWREDFMAFYLHIGPKPPGSTISLDRINNLGHYEPGNVRWAIRPEKAKNTRHNYGSFHKHIVKFRDLLSGPPRQIHLGSKSPKRPPVPVSENSNEKWCSVCKAFLDRSKFGRDKGLPDGLTYRCRECHNRYCRDYKAKDRAKRGIPYVGPRHGLSGTSEYKAWGGAKQRTTNPNLKCWDFYGGRGIKMCEEWLNSFKAFYDHIGPKPSPEHTLDRIDGKGDYEPGNVRWATMKQQANNKKAYKSLPRLLQEFRELHTGPPPP